MATASELDPADMISRLPDSVLSHVLSFLPTKYAVATSVLSKRWEFLWTQIHSLYFDDNVPSIGRRVGGGAGRRMTFPEFVERVMLLRNTQYSMEKFHMNCCCCDENHINTWISSATAAGVRELILSVYKGQRIQLPRHVLTCNRLVVLKLSGGQILVNAQRACFPYLKTLHLRSVKYQNDAAFSQLISSCLVLEKLLIRRRKPDNVIKFDISSHTLKRLTVYFYSCATGEIGEVALKLDTKQLQFLKIWGKLSEMYDVKELPYLHEASVHTLLGSTGFNFFHSLHNIKFLSLSTSSRIHVHYLFFEIILASFCNLTRLTLEATCILDPTNNVEALTYQETESCRLPHHWKTRKSVNQPGLSRLSSVTLTGFHGGRCNIALAGYILENAKVLTKMEIRCRSQTSLLDKFNLLQTISEMPRVSPTCKIMFS